MPKEIYVKQKHDEPSVKAEEMAPEEIPQAPLETPLVEIEPITQRNVPVEGPITPIDVSENIKLETFVNKTIVNDNNVVDVPDYREKDKLLDEVRKMISEPPADFTTVLFNIIETTTIHHITETTSESPTTTAEEITMPTTILVTTTPAPETETIFVPVNPYNNEHINMYDEKLSIVTTADSTTPVSVSDRSNRWRRSESLVINFQWTLLLWFVKVRLRLSIIILTRWAAAINVD